MNAGLIADSVIIVLPVAIAIIFYVYSKNRIAIDKKVMQGGALAKAERMIANSAKAIVYQTEKEGGSSKDKLLTAFSYLVAILDLAHLPHPSAAYIEDKVKKSVTTIKQTKNFVNSIQTLTKEGDAAKQLKGETVVGELKEAKR